MGWRSYPLTLAARYTELNAQFWQGGLPAPAPAGFFYRDPTGRVVVRRVGSRIRWNGAPSALRYAGGSDAIGKFVPPTDFYPARIQVLSPLDFEKERQVLIHEMAHYAVFLAGDLEKTSHGPRYIAELERLAMMGETWALEQIGYYRDHP